MMKTIFKIILVAMVLLTINKLSAMNNRLRALRNQRQAARLDIIDMGVAGVADNVHRNPRLIIAARRAGLRRAALVEMIRIRVMQELQRKRRCPGYGCKHPQRRSNTWS